MPIPGDVTAASAEETWQREDQIYDFQQCTVPHIPRAWERAPKSSFAPRHKGRMVWKRYELRATEVDPTLHENVQGQAGDFEGGLRPIKRRRAKQASEARDLSNNQTPPRFFTTLREQPHGTPRRKVTKRTNCTNLKGSKSIPQNRPATDSQSVCKNDDITLIESVFGTPDKNVPTPKIAPEMGSVLLIEGTGGDGLLVPPASPDSIFEQGSSHAPNKGGQNTQEPSSTGTSPGGWSFEGLGGKTSAIQEESAFKSCKEDIRSQDSIEAQYRGSPPEEAIQPDTQRSIAKLYTPVADVLLKDNPHQGIDHLENANTPIEFDTSRETLYLDTSADLEKNHVLEVEELSTDVGTSIVISDDSRPYDDVINDLSDLTSEEVISTRHPCEKLSPPSTKTQCSNSPGMEIETTAEITGSNDNAAARPSSVDKEGYVMQIDSSAENFEPQGVQTGSKTRIPDNAATVQADDAPPSIVKEEDTQGRTRSGTRFSDDTSMLKDFLSRAQARKAVIPKRKAESTRPVPVPPRCSPRKVLGQLDNNSPTPARSRDLEKRLDTPLEKKMVENIEIDKIGDELADPISCRRSTRTRLPAPAKKSAGVPSFIPVRRVDGTDPVVLQKSVAQELAVVTRANTRRNKGESRPPKLMLPDIVVEASENADATKQTEICTKMVSWDERLAYYQEAGETKEGKEETRPRVRRLRGLGSANGTPAAKKVTMDMTTPGPRRPGRSRG